MSYPELMEYTRWCIYVQLATRIAKESQEWKNEGYEKVFTEEDTAFADRIQLEKEEKARLVVEAGYELPPEPQPLDAPNTSYVTGYLGFQENASFGISFTATDWEQLKRMGHPIVNRTKPAYETPVPVKPKRKWWSCSCCC